LFLSDECLCGTDVTTHGPVLKQTINKHMNAPIYSAMASLMKKGKSTRRDVTCTMLPACSERRCDVYNVTSM